MASSSNSNTQLSLPAPADDAGEAGVINDLILNLTSATSDIRVFTLCLRSTFVQSPDIPEFIRMRDSVAKNALVYQKRILPLSTAVVETIDEFFLNYQALTFEEFASCITDLADTAQRYSIQADYVVELHEHILRDLKKVEDDANSLLGVLKLEEKKQREMAERLSVRLDKRSKLLWLMFIPVVNVIAAPILYSQTMTDVSKEVAATGRKEIASAAALAVSETLAPSLQSFIRSVEGFAGFFSELEHGLRRLSESTSDYSGAKLLHYKRMKARAAELRERTAFYIRLMPAVRSDFESLPDPDVLTLNYVDRWLVDRQSKLEGQSLFVRGKEIFSFSKRILAESFSRIVA